MLFLLLRIRGQALRNRLRALREFRKRPRAAPGDSLLKVAVVLVMGTGLWVGLLAAFLESFQFLGRFPEIQAVLVDHLFSLFFLSLAMMLVFSNAILSFAALFRSAETTYLLALPLEPEAVFLYKNLESLLFSSWAFLLLGLPLMLAYGWENSAHWSYYLGIPAYFLTLVVLVAFTGSAVALLLTAYFPRSRIRLLTLALIATLGYASYQGLVFSGVTSPGQYFTEEWLEKVLGRLSVCQNPLLPSYWVSKGLLALARGELRKGLFYCLVLFSTGMLAVSASYFLSSLLYARSWSERLGGRAPGGRISGELMAFLFSPLLRMRPRLGVVMLKDVRTFLRDSAQWSQVAIFFGILGLYVLNLRNFSYRLGEFFWANLTSFLNLTATALILATFTTRFVFPLISMEGKRLWVLSPSPLERRELLRAKFLFSFLGSTVVTELLVLGSNIMLCSPRELTLLHLATMAGISWGLSGIATGLGAVFPDFTSDNPAKIVSGFGGTLTLVISVAFVVLVLGLSAVPGHLYLARPAAVESYRRALGIALAASLVISLVVGWLPMRLGARKLEMMEW